MRLLALDGNSIINRAYYGIRPLTAADGTPTNAVYGFLNILGKLTDETSPDVIAAAFDMRAPTFRHKRYDGYKAGRKPMPDDLAIQLPIVKELLVLMGCTVIEKEGYEADDILGTLSEMSRKSGDECVIATGDRDSFQLIGGGTSVRFASTKMGRPEVTLYTEERIREEYGVEPRRLIDIKAIQGDASDNIPGVTGIGAKGAGELIRKFGSLQGVYDNIDSSEIKPAMRQKLIDCEEQARLSLWLGEICREVPLQIKIEDMAQKSADTPALAERLASLGLFSVMKRMGIEPSAAARTDNAAEKPPAAEYVKAADLSLPSGECAALAGYDSDRVVSLDIFSGGKVYCYDETTCDFQSVLARFADANNIKKTVYDIKRLSRSCGRDIVSAAGDPMLSAYLLDPSSNSYELDRLFAAYSVSVPESGGEEPYSARAAKAAALGALCAVMDRKIDECGMRKLLSDIELPLAEVLAHMEQAGFLVDADGIKNFGVMLDAGIEESRRNIYLMAAGEFNINSTKQLGEVLFERLGLPARKKTKSGYSTGADVLEELRGEHPIIDEILNYRSMTKLRSTYVEGLLKVVGDDGRIHSSLNQTETRTGRISSSEPNLQNIPVRQPLGRELRRYFTAQEGYLLVDADYSQIELRVLAHMAHDEQMTAAFKNGDDIHTITASQIFSLPVSMITPLLRSRAKAVNFGIVYGIGAFSLAKDTGVTRREADEYIKNYLATYSGVDDYMKRLIQTAADRGYAETMFGRRRYLPELASKNRNLRGFGERVARNMPIQGTAADIIKIAMINVERRLSAEGLAARLIMQVHDELIIEARERDAERAGEILRYEMENAVKLDVPLTAEVHMGKTWYDAKGSGS